MADKSSPCDYYIQIIDGAAEIIINGKKHQFSLGLGIIIPAHAFHMFNAAEQFKMISTGILRVDTEIKRLVICYELPSSLLNKFRILSTSK